jgi:hypothetical protein
MLYVWIYQYVIFESLDKTQQIFIFFILSISYPWIDQLHFRFIVKITLFYRGVLMIVVKRLLSSISAMIRVHDDVRWLCLIYRISYIEEGLQLWGASIRLNRLCNYFSNVNTVLQSKLMIVHIAKIIGYFKTIENQ